MINIQPAQIVAASEKAVRAELTIQIGVSERDYRVWIPRSACKISRGYVVAMSQSIMITKEEEIATELRAKMVPIKTLGIKVIE